MKSRGLLVFTLLVSLLFGALPVARANTTQELSEVMLLPDTERATEYMGMVYQTKNWTKGKIVSRNPLSVVIDDAPANSPAAYQLQVWRGVAVRVEDDLITEWDLLSLNDNGEVIEVIEDYDRALPDYFQALSQSEFQTMEHIARYPWSNLPTDREAIAAGINPIPKDGAIDVYGLLPGDGTVAISSLSEQVKPILKIPRIAANNAKQAYKRLPEKDVSKIPADIAKHWGKDYILDLMRHSIVVGYADQSIQPNGTLTKAEFITMFVRALQMELIDDAALFGYTDIKGHWASREIQIMLEAGLILPNSEAFKPNKPITRLEMTRLLGQALQSLNAAYKPIAPASKELFNDLQQLGDNDLTYINQLKVNGILSGDPHGLFHPNDSLTRAEACKVLALYLKLK